MDFFCVEWGLVPEVSVLRGTQSHTDDCHGPHHGSRTPPQNLRTNPTPQQHPTINIGKAGALLKVIEEKLQKPIAALFFDTGGQPPRGEELATLNLRDTATGVSSLRIALGFIVYYCAPHIKSRSK